MMKVSKQNILHNRVKEGLKINLDSLELTKHTWNSINNRLMSAINDPNSFHYESKPGAYVTLQIQEATIQTAAAKRNQETTPQTQNSAKKSKVSHNDNTEGTDSSKGMLKLMESANLLRFNYLQIKNNKKGHLANICAHFLIQGQSCRFKDKCNKSHVYASSKIKDRTQRNTVIDHVLQNSDLIFLNKRDAVKTTGTQ